ncbi:progranulin isoform X1 [Paramisgurnus dabryanus]|uniref:progranulin isoform X1 n=1 Tax=Paramisgurnus dabryanus TaxID=90735 RepID=UPI0031F43C72
MVPVLMFLMAVLVAADDLSAPAGSASPSVVYCDSFTYCPDGTTCCRNLYGHWFCCPFAMGQCCRDGVHCCRHGYHCDSTSTRCLMGWLNLPTSVQTASKAIQKTEFVLMDEADRWENQVESVQCDVNVYCPVEMVCCQTPTGQWGCCKGSML